jgi:UDP:flavonoid glycosyltransferase YjiC (YdhE family)
VEVFRGAIAERSYDLIIGDETYEIALALRARTVRVSAPFFVIYDFIGADAATRHPLELLGAYVTNRRWAYGYRRAPDVPITTFFIGEAEDVPDRPFGPGLPNRRRWVRERCRILGYVLPFDVDSCSDKTAMRRKLGYGEGPLVLCTAGGSGVGGELLRLCVASFPHLQARRPELQMEIVGGPRLELPASDARPGLRIRGYVPNLFEHFAAADLVVTQGGGTTTLELTALRRPFLYFPLEGHFEQQIHVAGRLARHGAGVRMEFSATTPELLADRIMGYIGAEVTYAPIPPDGAKRLAEAAKLLIGDRQGTPREVSV